MWAEIWDAAENRRRTAVLSRPVALDGRPIPYHIVAVLRRGSYIWPARTYSSTLRQRVYQLVKFIFHYLCKNKNYLLMYRVHPSKLHVRLGEFDIIGRLAVNATVPSDYTTTPSVDAENNLFGVDSLIIHEQYEPRSHVNDMSVWHFSLFVTLNS